MLISTLIKIYLIYIKKKKKKKKKKKRIIIYISPFLISYEYYYSFLNNK